MDKLKRPINVTIGAWMIIVVSALIFVLQVVSIPRTLAMPTALVLRLVILVAGLAVAAFLLAVGVAVLRGANWARITFLIGELVVLNFAVVVLGMDESPHRPAETFGDLFPGIFYLIVLILLTRQSALIYFGRPVAPAMKIGKTVLAVVLFCFVYAGMARLAGALGARTFSMATDNWNPVSAIGNSVGEATGLPLLESSTHLEVRTLIKSINASPSLEQLGDVLSSPVYKARIAVKQHDLRIMLLWIAHFISVPILLRRH